MSASVTSSILNLINNVIGAGLFSMPWCLKQSTLLTGSAVFVFMALLNIRSFMLLAESCEMVGKYSYLEIGKHAFGQRFGRFAQGITCFYTAGSLVSYVVLAADCLVGENESGDGTGVLSLWMEGSFLGDGSTKARALCIYAMGLVVFLPFSLFRNLDALRHVSVLAFFATLFAGFLVVFQLAANNPASARADDGGDDDDHQSSESGGHDGLAKDVQWFGLPLGVWQAVPIINVAFTAHYNGPRFFVELKHRTLPNFQAVVGASLGGALLVYLSVGICGYLSFGENTVGDVLDNFKASYDLAIGARLSLLAILAACFPKVQHSLRDGLVRLLYGGAASRAAVDASGDPVPQSADDLPTGPYVLLTLGVVLVACTLGAVCTQVEVVLAYKGGIFGTLMVYILPPLIHTAISMDYPGGSGGGGSGALVSSGAGGGDDEAGMWARLPGDEPHYDPHGKDQGTLGPIAPTWRVLMTELFCKREHRLSAFIFSWGCASGVLAVSITILKQAEVID